MNWTDAAHNLYAIGDKIAQCRWEEARREIEFHIQLFVKYSAGPHTEEIHQPKLWARAIQALKQVHGGVRALSLSPAESPS